MQYNATFKSLIKNKHKETVSRKISNIMTEK